MPRAKHDPRQRGSLPKATGQNLGIIKKIKTFAEGLPGALGKGRNPNLPVCCLGLRPIFPCATHAATAAPPPRAPARPLPLPAALPAHAAALRPPHPCRRTANHPPHATPAAAPSHPCDYGGPLFFLELAGSGPRSYGFGPGSYGSGHGEHLAPASIHLNAAKGARRRRSNPRRRSCTPTTLLRRARPRYPGARAAPPSTPLRTI